MLALAIKPPADCTRYDICEGVRHAGKTEALQLYGMTAELTEMSLERARADANGGGTVQGNTTLLDGVRKFVKKDFSSHFTLYFAQMILRSRFVSKDLMFFRVSQTI